MEKENAIQQLKLQNPETLQQNYTKQINTLNLEKQTLELKLSNITESFRKERDESDKKQSSVLTALSVNKKKLEQLEKQIIDLQKENSLQKHELDQLS